MLKDKNLEEVILNKTDGHGSLIILNWRLTFVFYLV
jgi:hypothetical protein